VLSTFTRDNTTNLLVITAVGMDKTQIRALTQGYSGDDRHRAIFSGIVDFTTVTVQLLLGALATASGAGHLSFVAHERSEGEVRNGVEYSLDQAPPAPSLKLGVFSEVFSSSILVPILIPILVFSIS
jgi:hypothetical protein